MPSITGMKAYAISGLIRDHAPNQSEYEIDEEEELAPPENGINTNDLFENELMGQYFVPNWARPLPMEEFGLEDEADQSAKDEFIDE